MITAEFTSDQVNLRVTNLYQWDVNQVIKIMGLDFGYNPVEVHFCNKKSTGAIVVNSTTPSGGSVFANIPNVLLQEPYDIVAYVYMTKDTTKSTTNTITIPVVKRKKPNGYADTSGGNIVIPDSEVNINLSAANATRSDIVSGKVAFIASGQVTGTHVCPSLGSAQTKTVTPTKAVQTVTADEGKYLSSVTVNPIPSNYSNITTSFDATTGTLTITEA